MKTLILILSVSYAFSAYVSQDFETAMIWDVPLNFFETTASDGLDMTLAFRSGTTFDQTLWYEDGQGFEDDLDSW